MLHESSDTRRVVPVHRVVSTALEVALIRGQMMLLRSPAYPKVLPKRKVTLTTHNVAARVQRKPRTQPISQQVLSRSVLNLRDHSTTRVNVIHQHCAGTSVVLSNHL